MRGRHWVLLLELVCVNFGAANADSVLTSEGRYVATSLERQQPLLSEGVKT
jgi:hypothetical protein